MANNKKGRRGRREIFWPAKQGERKIVVWSLKTSCLEKEKKEKLEKEQEEKLEKEQREVKERVEKERQKSLNSQGIYGRKRVVRAKRPTTQ